MIIIAVIIVFYNFIDEKANQEKHEVIIIVGNPPINKMQFNVKGYCIFSINLKNTLRIWINAYQENVY